MAPFGHAETQAPQATHAALISAPPSPRLTAPGAGHTTAHAAHSDFVLRKREHSVLSSLTGTCSPSSIKEFMLAETDALRYLDVYCTLGLVSAPPTLMLTPFARLSRMTMVSSFSSPKKRTLAGQVVTHAGSRPLSVR